MKLYTLTQASVKFDYDNDRVRARGFPHSVWYEFGELEAYIRVFNDKIVVANIALLNPEHEGQGYFRSFMAWVEAECVKRRKLLEFENVMNPRLLNHLLKNGFAVNSHDDGNVVSSVIKQL